jgi:integrase
VTFATREEALAWVEAARRGARFGGETLPLDRTPAPLLGDAARDFLRRALDGKALNRARKAYSPATVASYESALRLHVLPHHDERHGVALADLPADAVDTRTMQALVNALTTGASPSLARIADAALVAVLRDLYERGVLDAVPVRPILPPPPPGRDVRVSVAEADRLLAEARADDARTGRSLMEPLVALLIGTGCRIGEALGLRWGADGLDLEAGTVSVVRETTKTDAGARTLGMERETLAVLRRHRLATGRPLDGTPVFAREDGTPLGRDGRVRSGLARVARAAGVTVTPHGLRHSHGSWLADAGEGGHDIAARLGHRDAAFTARRYVHADRAKLAEAPAALAALRERERRAG